MANNAAAHSGPLNCRYEAESEAADTGGPSRWMRLPMPCQQDCGFPGNSGVNGGNDTKKPPFPGNGHSFVQENGVYINQ